jgi:hypothetical protein
VGVSSVAGHRRGEDDHDREQERQALEPVLRAARAARLELPPGSEWDATLALLEEEIGEGQPLIFRVRSASDSRSSSDAPVVST